MFTVAIVGPIFGLPMYEVFGGPDFANHGPDLPYASRTKAEVSASSTMTLGEVIDRAALDVGITVEQGRVSEALTGVVFYEPEDEVALKPRREPWPDTIRIVDANGTPSWRVRWDETRVDELLEAHAAGLGVGDPHRPYLWPTIPQGDLLQQFHESLWTLWNAWEYILSGYGTYEIGRRVLDRVRRGRASFTDEGGLGLPWPQRLGRPHDLFAYLAGEARRAAEVASLLGCSTQQAEGVLWGMGFVCGDDGLWRVAQDAAGRALYESVQQIRVLGRAPRRAELQAILELGPPATPSQSEGDE